MESRRKMRMLRWMCGAMKKDEDAEVDVWSHEERLRMLRWMCGVTKRDEEAEVDVWSHEG